MPHTASAHLARWHLPIRAGGQALVPVGHGRVLLAGGLLAGDVSTDRVVEHGPDTAVTRVAAPTLAVPVHDVAGAGSRVGSLSSSAVATPPSRTWCSGYKGGAWTIIVALPTARSDLSVVPHGPSALVVGG